MLNFCSPDPFQRAEIGTEIDNSDRLNAVAESWDVVSGLQDEILTLYPVIISHHRRGERVMRLWINTCSTRGDAGHGGMILCCATLTIY